LFVASCYCGIAIFENADASARVVLGPLHNGEETVDAEGCFGLDLPDEVLIWLERLQDNRFLVLLRRHSELGNLLFLR